MAQQIVTFLAAHHIPAALVVLIISVLPVIELRASIPIGIGLLRMSAVAALFWSVLGNLLIAPVLYSIVDWCVTVLMHRVRPVNKFFDWLFAHTRSRYARHLERYEVLGLVIVATLPVPGFGTWGAVAAAYVFGISLKKAYPAIALGVIFSGILVTLLSTGAFALFGN